MKLNKIPKKKLALRHTTPVLPRRRRYQSLVLKYNNDMDYILTEQEYNKLKDLAEKGTLEKYMDIRIRIYDVLHPEYNNDLYTPIEYTSVVSSKSISPDLKKTCMGVNKDLEWLCNKLNTRILEKTNRLDQARKRLTKMCWFTGILNIILFILILWKLLS